MLTLQWRTNGFDSSGQVTAKPAMGAFSKSRKSLQKSTIDNLILLPIRDLPHDAFDSRTFRVLWFECDAHV